MPSGGVHSAWLVMCAAWLQSCLAYRSPLGVGTRASEDRLLAEVRDRANDAVGRLEAVLEASARSTETAHHRARTDFLTWERAREI